jgi:hypothetical protein
MGRLFFLFLFLLYHFYTFAYSFDEILDSIYTVQCRNMPLEFRYQVDLYNKTRRTEEVKSLLFRNTTQNDTLIIVELYKVKLLEKIYGSKDILFFMIQSFILLYIYSFTIF